MLTGKPKTSIHYLIQH